MSSTAKSLNLNLRPSATMGLLVMPAVLPCATFCGAQLQGKPPFAPRASVNSSVLQQVCTSRIWQLVCSEASSVWLMQWTHHRCSGLELTCAAVGLGAEAAQGQDARTGAATEEICALSRCLRPVPDSRPSQSSPADALTG